MKYEELRGKHEEDFHALVDARLRRSEAEARVEELEAEILELRARALDVREIDPGCYPFGAEAGPPASTNPFA